MTIDEAIKILHQDIGANTYDNYPGLYEAQKLAIEALKRLRETRDTGWTNCRELLSGETKEGERK